MSFLNTKNSKFFASIESEVFETKDSLEFSSIAHLCPENNLNLNDHLIKNPIATFFLRAASDALKGAGIFSGDLLVVDRSSKPNSGDIVIAELDGELSIRHYERKGHEVTLSTDYSHIDFHLSNPNEISIWGVVKAAIHSL
jgi:DNA polymerase V